MFSLVGPNVRYTLKAVGKPGVIQSASPSPDGRYVMIDERHHPYSYLPPFYFFPERTTVVNLGTGHSRPLADKPLEDTIPNIHDAVEAGPREFGWRSDTPATAFWVEAADGGDPRKEVPIRDTLYLLDAPFDGQARELAELPLRFRSVTWGDGRLALVEQERWKDRKRIMLAVSPDTRGATVKLFEGSFEDRYHDPGRPFEVMNASGKRVLEMAADASGIYLRAEGCLARGRPPVSRGYERGEWPEQAAVAVGGQVFRVPGRGP